jgi:2-dehydropantoate 2-reductase
VKIAILGAGAVGLTVAARLSAVAEVYAVCRRQQADTIRSRGFLMSGIWGEGVYHFPCGEDLEPAEYDYIIISVKATGTRAVCEQFADMIDGVPVISLQNGIGNEEIIAEYTDHVIGGMIITGFEWAGDGAVKVTVEASPMRLGRFPRGAGPAEERLAGLICEAGIAVETSDDIRRDIWGKALYNCALNPLGAIMDVPYGQLAHPAAWAVIRAIVSEAFDVASAEGVTLAWHDAESYLAYLRNVQLPATAGHHASMLQDLRRGRRTEIDFLNGAIAALGEWHGISTPYNTCISEMIRFRESLLAGTE